MAIGQIGNEKWPEYKKGIGETFQSEIIEDAIEKIGENELIIGEGRTAKVSAIPGYESVCLKTIHDKAISKHGGHKQLELLDRLSLNNVSVPRPICSVENKENDYLFMEKIFGCSLKDLVEKDLLKEAPGFNLEKFFNELKEEVEKMHEQKIYHRDLHEGNIMLEWRKMQPVIIDFGESVINYISSDDPYREADNSGKVNIYPNDEQKIKEVYKYTAGYLKNKGYFNKK